MTELFQRAAASGRCFSGHEDRSNKGQCADLLAGRGAGKGRAENHRIIGRYNRHPCRQSGLAPHAIRAMEVMLASLTNRRGSLCICSPGYSGIAHFLSALFNEAP
jgi:hypothetical protein